MFSYSAFDGFIYGARSNGQSNQTRKRKRSCFLFIKSVYFETKSIAKFDTTVVF